MTMVRQYLPQSQLGNQALSADLSYNSLPASPRTATQRDAISYEQQDRRRQPLPQQYAHPLQRNNSYPLQSAGRGMEQPELRYPEHMLRRKTPNGILSAAYDGTSVEQTEKPHAMKHILLPASSRATRGNPSSHYGYGMQQDLPLRSPGMDHVNGYLQNQPNPPNGSATWNADMGFGHVNMNDNWQRMPLNLPQIDSMLNQMPMQQAHMQYQQIYGAFQPSLQSPLGPTASGDQLPYGPYLPNGTFVPYRPAALRDHRFYSNSVSPWMAYPSHGVQPSHNPMSHHSHFGPNNPQIPLNLETNLYPPVEKNYPYAFSPTNQLQTQNYQPNYFPPQNHTISRQYDLQSSSTFHDQYALLDSGQSTPLASTTNLSSASNEYGPQSGNLQARERHYRRHNSQQRNNNHQHSRSTWHPKPPRQPGANFSSSQSESIRYEGTKSQNSIDRHRDAQIQAKLSDKYRTLRRTSGQSIAGAFGSGAVGTSTPNLAHSALEALSNICNESPFQWVDGMLLVGCLAYALGDYNKANDWYTRILDLDPDNVEAMSNLAATLLALGRKQDAEHWWTKSIKLRPSYFEAVEHLIGLLCGDNRTKGAVKIIEHIERALKYVKGGDTFKHAEVESNDSNSISTVSEDSDSPVFDFDAEGDAGLKDIQDLPGSDQPGFGSSGYAIPGCDNGRMLALVHAKGNMLYALGDNSGAAKAFDTAVMIGAGRKLRGITGLISHILSVVSKSPNAPYEPQSSKDPVLLPPEKALTTARLCFPSDGDLPGLKYVMAGDGVARKAAISTTSNSLLSLAKIFQDGMATNSPKTTTYQADFNVREILALYYLSLSLQPSPSTANNVGILLASVQQSVPNQNFPKAMHANVPKIPGITPGSGIALALMYYNYGLQLDQKHAHLYTNLGSLLKDIGQLGAAIQMYEHAVKFDGNFDIALANLANAVKDQGRIQDAIEYYKRAVQSNPNFAEAICGLANALNSVCGWAGRGGIAAEGGARDRWHVNEQGMLLDARTPGAVSTGWIKRVVDLVEKQLAEGETWGIGVIDESFIEEMAVRFPIDENTTNSSGSTQLSVRSKLQQWSRRRWEGARVVRLVERVIRRLGWQWYHDNKRGVTQPSHTYIRPRLPSSMTVPQAPTVLPFHTFTCPMSAKQIRLISQRNGLRISTSTLKAPWLPSTVFRPPPPPKPYLKVGYVSSDFNNHPLAHLMQSVFGLHDRSKVKAFCYATTASDSSVHRQQIEKEAPVFYDASTWSAERLVHRVVDDGIHILINLNGYTRGARNEVFAARPAPIHMSFMGFAGTLGAEWCDYLLADETAIPRSTLRPFRDNVTIKDQLLDENSGGNQDSWVYGENIVFCRDTFFCCDHRQSAPDAKERQLTWEEEQVRRWKMRKEIFPQLPDDVIILGNFNQLYKIEPTTFRTWLRILAGLPKAILWLLRFPDLGESHLRSTAMAWAGHEVASRILFTDVAPKHQHIARARVCDLFLDTPECNAHTTAADVLWSGTPLITFPRYDYKMCSRMAASILKGALPKTPAGAQAAKDLVMSSEEEYEKKAIELGKGCHYDGHRLQGRLSKLRRTLYESRWSSALFDTKRWVRDLEEAYEIVWKRWERGQGGDVWLSEKRVQEVA